MTDSYPQQAMRGDVQPRRNFATDVDERHLFRRDL
jgi:hypothetical protein